MKLNNGIRLTWLGHATFKFETEGKTFLIDPWVDSNPACPDELKTFDKLDVMYITHGHWDHTEDAVPIAKKHSPTVVAMIEVAKWLESKGVQNTIGMNKGGTVSNYGVKATMVTANHSSSVTEEDGTTVYMGEPAGFVLEFANGYKIYHAGDTNVFGDMQIIGEIYQPDLALLPIGDHFTMGPREAAYAVKLLKVPAILPMHYGTFPLLTGTLEEFLKLTASMDVEIVDLEVGGTLE
ncbi:MAG: metal-dependent hydrolase [Candidatus Poribacteria bacterium]|nr:metal-dependent hydrolase [Candidatus Poribacteria bacterium]